MSRFRAAIFSAVAVTALAAPAVAVAASVPDELIVRFEPGASAAERAAIRDAAGTELRRTLPVPGMQLLEIGPDRPVSEAEGLLERDDAVLYAEPNAVRRAFLRPNDPYFDLLWGIENAGQTISGVAGSPDADTDAADAWDANVSGGVLVAVLDTGVDRDHPDLAASAWRNPGESGSGRESNGVDDDLNGRVDDWRGWDFVGRDNDPFDENWHGTHVAGTIAARRNNALGVAGVADRSRVLALRVLDAQGSGSVADVILAYAYAAAAGAKVVNLSLGSPTSSRAERDAIAAFPQMLFVAAAGNGGGDGVGDDNDLNGQYPCAYLLPNVLCVAASDNRDQLAGFSNYGARSVDLAAPGVSIVSTSPRAGYSWASGSSMATPHVTGAASLLWAAAPSASVSDIASALLAGTDAGQAFSGRTLTGGRLNVLRSLRMVANVSLTSPAPAPPPGASPAPAPPGEPPPTPAPAASPTPAPARQPAAVGDRVPPHVSLRVARRVRMRTVLRRGLAVRVRCSEACRARANLRSRRRTLGASRPTSILAGVGRRLVVRVPRAARAILRSRRPRRLVLVVRATDAAANRLTLRRSIPLRR
jgi:subtilisin family serine protease